MAKSETVTITHKARGKGGRYVAHVEGEPHTGHLDWENSDQADVRIATHTIVPPEIGGRGIAGLLVNRLIEDAREHSFRVVPQCWYVAKKFDENPDWAELKA
ncbi:MAG: GNAT family N-acetyltransferase [Pseudomonadota bacterium]